MPFEFLKDLPAETDLLMVDESSYLRNNRAGQKAESLQRIVKAFPDLRSQVIEQVRQVDSNLSIQLELHLEFEADPEDKPELPEFRECLRAA